MIAAYPALGAEPQGGVEQSVLRLVRGLTQTGAEVVVVAPGMPRTELRDGVTAVFVPCERRLALVRGLRVWRRSVRDALAKVNVDVIHGQGLVTGGIGAANCPGLRVATAHGSAEADTAAAYRGPGRAARMLARRRLARIAVEAADVVVGVHPDWRQNVPVRPRAFVHIPNIVDDVFFSATRRAAGPDVLFCGGPKRIKGWDVLAGAWQRVLRRLPDASLRLVGWPDDGPPPALPDGTTLDAAGWLSSTHLRSAMEQASLLVIPSRFEVAPLVLLEAWAAGLPVVATTAGGLAALAPGAAAVVPSEDPESLAREIVAVLSRARDVAPLVAEGRRRALGSQAATVAERHLSVYRDLLERD
jgi:glycosyltransferase involved in cell wall biosynthesis